MSYIDPRTKLLYHVDRLAKIKAGKQPPPINVEVDLSNRCSLGCEWCHFAYTHTRGPLTGKRLKPVQAIPGGDLMDRELALRLMAELETVGARSITWTGGGEPTLHPHFDEIIEATQLDQGIYTHGGHINRDRAELMKRKMRWVYVSLDAWDREDYRRTKAVDYFYRACEGVHNLVRAEGRATIGLGFLLTRDNWIEAEKAAILGEQLGVDYIQYRPTVIYHQESPSQPAEDVSWLDDCIAWLKTIEHPKVLADAERFEMYRNWDGRGYPVCWWTMLQCVVTPNGKVWVCVNRREHRDSLLGDLNSESFETIWGAARPWTSFERCRVMCRGHIPNLSLDAVMNPPEHANFP